MLTTFTFGYSAILVRQKWDYMYNPLLYYTLYNAEWAVLWARAQRQHMLARSRRYVFRSVSYGTVSTGGAIDAFRATIISYSIFISGQ